MEAIKQGTLEHLKAIFDEAEWNKWLVHAHQLDEACFWLPLLDDGIKTLVEKCGLEPVRKVYHPLLKSVVQQRVEKGVESELESLAFEILCLAKLASVADEFVLLEGQAPKAQATPDAALKIVGHDCLVEVRAPIHPSLRKEFWGGNLEGLSFRLRETLREALPKFSSSPETVNLVLVSHLEAPFPNISVAPALYGDDFLYRDLDEFIKEFAVPYPDELGKGALFGQEGWEVISGVGWVAYANFPDAIHWSGFIFPNPKANRTIPFEVAIATHQALNLKTFPANKDERLRASQWLLPRFVEMLSAEFGAQKVIPFGSVRDTIFWHRRSDIDLAVDGLDWRKLPDIEAALFDRSPWVISVHLMLLGDLPEWLQRRLKGDGNPISDWREKVREELAEIDRGLQRMRDYCTDKDPSTDLGALVVTAKAVHDFYEGAERILKRVIIAFGEELPAGEKWHKELLEKACQPTEKRPPVISQCLKAILDDYREFRHLFRHIYFFNLDYQQMAHLAERLSEVAQRFQTEIEDFLKTVG